MGRDRCGDLKPFIGPHPPCRTDGRRLEEEIVSTSSSSKRFAILMRDGFACVYCGATSAESALEIDHSHPRSKGGGNDDDNLVTSCRTCNNGKGAATLSDKPRREKARAASNPGLIGKCFITRNANGQVVNQGIVRAEVGDGSFLVQTFDWFMGEPCTMHIVQLGDMLSGFGEPGGLWGSWTFFEDCEHLKFWMEHRYRDPDPPKPSADNPPPGTECYLVKHGLTLE
jgi:hypothetical protein